MFFQKIESKRKSLQVAEQIAEAIRLNIYKVGDRLPPERVIAEQMGVSRPSVREALSALQLVGVLESRPGNGTYVVKPLDRRDEVVLLLGEESPVEALEARRVLERVIIQMAVARATPSGLESLRRAQEALRAAAEVWDYETFTSANSQFHLAIVKMTGNDLLVRALRPLVDIMQRALATEMRRREYALDGAFFEAMYGAHAAIVEALQQRDAARAAEALDRHFDLIEASLHG